MAGIAGLAMTSSAAAVSAPCDGITVSGEVSNAETQANLISQGTGINTAHDIFQIVIEDVPGRCIYLSDANYAIGFSDWGIIRVYDEGTVFDPRTTPSPVIINIFDEGQTMDLTTLPPGKYTLLIGADGVQADGAIGYYTFSLLGATLGWGPILDQIAQEQGIVAANEVAQALSASIFSAIKGGIQSDGAVVSRNTPFAGLKSGSGRTWFQADYTAIDGTDLEGRFPTLQGGFDFQLENGMLLGAALGYSDFSVRNATSDLKGESLTIQPYLGFQLGKTTGSVSLSFGQLDLDTADGAGSAEGDTRGINLSLERGFTLGGQQLVGEFGAGFGRQDIDEGTGTLAGLANTHSTWSYASLGARYEMQNGNVNSSIGGSIDYNDVGNLDNLSASHYGSDGFTGAINVSFDYGLANGSNVYLRGEVGGLGGDAIRKTVQAGIDFRF
ncbi:hypothetical protein [Halocynthiibacter sp.]|uniref:hypothetical protein n=1 Tax=Halocynthiibacter sp. TaxID=1979210 RepID=UPI003C3A1827